MSWVKIQLRQQGVSDDGVSDSANADSKALLGACLQQDLVYLMMWPEKGLQPAERERLMAWVTRRLKGEPIAYIIGYRDFWSLRLKVSPATLIPRADTETLVELALALDVRADAHVADLGTGTGAIALALGTERPSWSVLGCDLSFEAVALATENAQTNHITNVEFIQSNWFAELGNQVFDMIVSNPPYVESTSQYLTQGDVRFEPSSALTSGEDGLDDIRLIIQQAKTHLRASGWLVFEHGFEQGQAIRVLFAQAGFQHIATHTDLNGQDRVTCGQFG